MKRNAKRYGIIGGLCLPILLGALVFIRGTVQYDSFMYSALQKIFYTPTIPLFWLMDTIMEACGIQGDEGMAYIFPVFLAMLVYWALLGFGLGWLLGTIKDIRHNKGVQAIGDKSPQPDP